MVVQSMAVGSILIIAIPVSLPTLADPQGDMVALDRQKDMICIGRVQDLDLGPLVLDHSRQNLDQYHLQGKAEALDAVSGAALATAVTAAAAIEVAARAEIGAKVAIKTNEMGQKKKSPTKKDFFFRREIQYQLLGVRLFRPFRIRTIRASGIVILSARSKF